MPKANTSATVPATTGDEPAQRRSSRLMGKVTPSNANSTSSGRAEQKKSLASGTAASIPKKGQVKSEVKAEEGKKRKAATEDGKTKSKVVKVEKTADDDSNQPSKPEVSKSSAASTKESVKKEVAAKDIKVTIERCNTCTQYRTNVLRITRIMAKRYPSASVQEEVLPKTKSFEIYLSSNGSKNKLIWSGKAHAPPKRLAFPADDVYIDLLEKALQE